MPEEQSQITVTYHVDEDRLLLRMQLEGKELRVWFTRRMTGNLFGIVERLFDHLAGTGNQPSSEREAVSQFRQDRALTQADFSRPYDPGDRELYFPDGPLLATKIDFKPRKDGRVTVALSGAEGRKSVAFTLSEDDLRAVLQLFIGASRKGVWELKPPPSMEPERGDRRVIH